jgi:hypothetical protein
MDGSGRGSEIQQSNPEGARFTSARPPRTASVRRYGRPSRLFPSQIENARAAPGLERPGDRYLAGRFRKGAVLDGVRRQFVEDEIERHGWIVRQEHDRSVDADALRIALHVGRERTGDDLVERHARPCVLHEEIMGARKGENTCIEAFKEDIEVRCGRRRLACDRHYRRERVLHAVIHFAQNESLMIKGDFLGSRVANDADDRFDFSGSIADRPGPLVSPALTPLAIRHPVADFEGKAVAQERCECAARLLRILGLDMCVPRARVADQLWN